MPLSPGMSHDDLALLVYARLHGRFWTTFTEFVVERTATTIKFVIPVFHGAIGWCLIAIQRLKFIDALLSG